MNETETALACCKNKDCVHCPWKDYRVCLVDTNEKAVWLLKAEKQLAETQLKELLSALYQRTGEQGFTIYRKDIVEFAKDYGIKEEELNG